MSYYIPKILRKLLNRPAIRNSHIHPTARCDIGCDIAMSKMGKYSYTGAFTSLSMVEVGNYTSISSGCTIGGGSHPMHWAAMSTVFQNSRGIMRHKLAQHEYQTHTTTYIGSDVWIGGNCIIKGGVRIGDGAVVGMGSVVTHDVGPYEIWAGNPARMIRKRFDDRTIAELMTMRWWDWEDDVMKKRAGDITDVKRFIELYGGNAIVEDRQ